MKRLIQVIVAFLTAAVFSGCGGGGGLDCDAFCRKGVECNAGISMDECLQQCADFKKVINTQFANAIEACYAKSCTEIDTCVENAMKTCSGNINPFLDKFCAKIVFCYSDVTVEQCKSFMLNDQDTQYMKCLSSYTLNTMANCAQSASCSNFNAEWQACVEEKLDIDFSQD